MSAQILDGRALAKEIKSEMAWRIKEFSIHPGLAIIRVGDDSASDVYVRQKVRACEELGIDCKVHHYSKDVTQGEIIRVVKTLNEDPAVHGIIIQLPLPDTISEFDVQISVDPKKDVDGLHPLNSGRSPWSCYGPCTAEAVLKLAEVAHDSLLLNGLNATIIGRSQLVGMPTRDLLINYNATVTVCHSKTKDLAEHTRNADILVVAAGHPGLITADMVKPGAIVIDVGINRVNGKVVGDVDFEGVKEVAGWITPVPGGVGPMTVAILMRNVTEAALLYN